MYKKIILGVVATASFAGAAWSENNFNYTYLETQYLNVDTQRNDTTNNAGADISGSGFGLRGALAVTKTLHAYAEFEKQDLHSTIADVSVPFNVKKRELGLGVNLPLFSHIDFVGRAGYIKVDGNVGNISNATADKGYALQAGARALITNRIEVEGLAHYYDLNDIGDTLAFRLNGLYRFTDLFTGFAGAEIDSDTKVWMAGIRLNFPQK